MGLRIAAITADPPSYFLFHRAYPAPHLFVQSVLLKFRGAPGCAIHLNYRSIGVSDWLLSPSERLGRQRARPPKAVQIAARSAAAVRTRRVV
jgi:hypothetical protein